MLNDRLAVAKDVASQLLPAESDLENAIVHASRLTIAVVEGRRKARLPITVGQEALDHVAVATAQLIQARGRLGCAHVALRAAKEEIGLRTVAMGDLWDCPPATSGENVTPIGGAKAA